MSAHSSRSGRGNSGGVWRPVGAGSETKDSPPSPSESEGGGFTEQQLATLLNLIGESSRHQFQELKDCLLYTSDAADDTPV
eukprot:2735036-Pyramimonas_sp.AAC.1